jgi:hypothetical protein
MNRRSVYADSKQGGFALPAAVFALVVLGALMVGMIGAASASAADAFNLAEIGASEVLATQTDGFGAMPVWGVDTIADTLANGYYTVEVTRTSQRLFFLNSAGTVTGGGELRSGAVRHVGVIASVTTVDIEPPGTLTTRGPTTVSGTAEVIGLDTNPAGWSCTGTLEDMPGIVTDSGAVGTSGAGTITGDPATLADPTVAAWSCPVSVDG